MTAADWIALVQAGLLAAAAFFAARAYALSSREHREAREEAKMAPLRELYSDVVREVKEIAAASDAEVPGIGITRSDVIQDHQARLRVALAFLQPDVFNLFATKALAECAPSAVNRDGVAKATSELLRLYGDIADGVCSADLVALPSVRAERLSRSSQRA